ncbi:MAG: TonB family protein [Nitrospirae bacterium]|nr:TonB family protein [Nitrospirota bacterium]
MVLASAVAHVVIAIGLVWAPTWMPSRVPLQAYQVRLVSLPVEHPSQTHEPPATSAPRPEPPRKPPVKKTPPVVKLKAPKKPVEAVVAPTPIKGPQPAVVASSEPVETPATQPHNEPAPKPAPDQVAKAVEPVDPGITLVTPLMEAVALKYPYYMNALVRKMDANWSPPGSGSGEGREVLVTFTILRDGSVRDPGIGQSSGNVFYDQAALRSVQRSIPFPPLPPGYPEDNLKVHFSFLLDPNRSP